jgi:hypothetical protein
VEIAPNELGGKTTAATKATVARWKLLGDDEKIVRLHYARLGPRAASHAHRGFSARTSTADSEAISGRSKKAGLSTALASAVTVGAELHGMVSSHQPIDFLLPSILAVDVLFALLSAVFITPAWVMRAAQLYADRLMEAICIARARFRADERRS